MVVSFDTAAELVADLTDDVDQLLSAPSRACGPAEEPRSTMRFISPAATS